MIKHFPIALLSVLLSISPSIVLAQVSDNTDTIYESIPSYYYRGNSKVDIQIVMDEYVLESKPGKTLNTENVHTNHLIKHSDKHSAFVRMSPSSTAKLFSEQIKALKKDGQRVFTIAYPKAHTERSNNTRQIITDQMTFKSLPDTNLDDLESIFGLTIVGNVSYDADVYIAEVHADDILAILNTARSLHESGLVHFAEPIIRQQHSTRFIPNDTLFNDLWHLRNTVPNAYFIAGNDANVVGAWDSVTGDGVNILIVDEGTEVSHEDLSANARTDIDYDYADDDDLPTPGANEFHGTNVAGIAAAVGNNIQGVTGAAYDASFIAIRLLSNQGHSDAQTASALSHLVDEVIVSNQAHVSNNSWGPTDHPSNKQQFASNVETAIANGINNGRDGKGIIYTWASGNGNQSRDRAPYDPYTNSRYTVTVAASGGTGMYSSYSEPGPCVLVNAPSQFRGKVGNSFASFYTTTTEVNNDYFSNFGGTSSAAPLAAGVIALMLEENPSLTWRDVQQILVESSSETDLTEASWQLNGAGHLYNENYGFGRVNGVAAVSAASNWTNLPTALTPITESETSLSIAIPDNNPTGLSRSLSVSPESAFSVEHVEVTIDIAHSDRGDLTISIVSPEGTESIFTKTHSDSVNDYNDWTFASVAHWGEDPTGDWTLKIIDGAAGGTGLLLDWSLTLHGTSPTTTIPTNATVTVDRSFKGYEQGTSQAPFNTLAEAWSHVSAGGILNLAAQSFQSFPVYTFDKPMTLDAPSGTATIE